MQQRFAKAPRSYCVRTSPVLFSLHPLCTNSEPEVPDSGTHLTSMLLRWSLF